MGMLTTFIVTLFSTSEPKIAEIRHTEEYGGLLQIRIAADNNRPCGSIHMTPERLDYIITCGRYAGKALMPHHDIILDHTGQQLVARYRSNGKILFKINCSSDEYRNLGLSARTGRGWADGDWKGKPASAPQSSVRQMTANQLIMPNFRVWPFHAACRCPTHT